MGGGNGLITKMSKQPGVEHDLAWLKRHNGSMFPGMLAGSVTRYPVCWGNGDVSQEARLLCALKLCRDSETPAPVWGKRRKSRNWDYTLKSRPNWWAGPLSLWWKALSWPRVVALSKSGIGTLFKVCVCGFSFTRAVIFLEAFATLTV